MSAPPASATTAFNMPAATPELCFDKNEFAHPSFTVDEFLHSHRSAATMEAMRDDLGVYLRVLRSAMIELINEDYADFVDLAANLRGLDTQMSGIQHPLQQLRSDIVAVRATLADTMAELREAFAEKRRLRGSLLAVQAAARCERSLANIGRLLAGDSTEAADAQPSSPINQTVLERVAMEYVQVSFEIQFCTSEQNAVVAASDEDGGGGGATTSISLALQADLQHRHLLAALEELFLHTLERANAGATVAGCRQPELTALERCLRIFCTLDECAAAEAIFRRCCVAPHMHPIISEQALQNSPQGVHGIYAQVLGFVKQRMWPLFELTTSNDTNGAAANTPMARPRVRGFDFLLRSYWPEVEHRLETHMSSIFAPGNPDQFYHKYQSTVAFLGQLDELLGTERARIEFHKGPAYRSFQQRWNLPVYFQIRFQEIGAIVEAACSHSVLVAGCWTAGEPRLVPVATALNCFRRCWSDGVYLPQLFQQFWKFALQILARVTHWLEEATQGADNGGGEWPAVGTAGTSAMPTTWVAALVACHADVRLMCAELPALLDVVVAASQPTMSTADSRRAILQRCLDETERTLGERLSALERRLCDQLVATIAPSIRLVNDIPRLYRKTNREVPSRPATYVDQMLRPAVQFSAEHSGVMEAGRTRALLGRVLCQLTKRYYVVVSDVLTSVQKTEESLRRLKNLRDRSTMSAAAAAVDSTGGGRVLMTDDDKIRLQLQVDVMHWSATIEDVLGVPRDAVEQLPELMALMEESTRVKVCNHS